MRIIRFVWETANLSSDLKWPADLSFAPFEILGHRCSSLVPTYPEVPPVEARTRVSDRVKARRHSGVETRAPGLKDRTTEDWIGVVENGSVVPIHFDTEKSMKP